MFNATTGKTWKEDMGPLLFRIFIDSVFFHLASMHHGANFRINSTFLFPVFVMLWHLRPPCLGRDCPSYG